MVQKYSKNPESDTSKEDDEIIENDNIIQLDFVKSALTNNPYMVR